MLFLDGVGIGKTDSAINPFFAAHLPVLRSLLQDELPSLHNHTLLGAKASVIPLDANLRVPGLPQSGTGQTALFAGVNGAKIIGKHFGPYPYSSLKPIIEGRNIFRQLRDANRRPYFANAFPQRFFDYIAHRGARITVTTLSCMMSGVRLLDARDLADGKGISADITNDGWPAMGYSGMRPIEPQEAGRRLARFTREYDFVLFEYWKTDHAGHSEQMHEAITVLERFDAMLLGVLEELDTRDTVLLITSDHGNIEDMSTKSHTRNPVPALLYGYSQDEITDRLRFSSPTGGDLTHVTPLLMEYLTDRR